MILEAALLLAILMDHKKEEAKQLTSVYAERFELPPSLVHAIVSVKSNYHPEKIGENGEIGLMQLNCVRVVQLGFFGQCSELHDMDKNLFYGMRALKNAYIECGRVSSCTIVRFRRFMEGNPKRRNENERREKQKRNLR